MDKSRIAIIKEGESEKYEKWLTHTQRLRKVPRRCLPIIRILKKYEGRELPLLTIRHNLLAVVRLPDGSEFSMNKKVFKIKGTPKQKRGRKNE